jgi:hypothetical protein
MRDVKILYTAKELISKRTKTVEFDSPWLDAFGNPELSGCWLVWGNSSQGKTSFVMQLCKYLTKFGKVLYNSMEEGRSAALVNVVRRSGVMAVNRRIVFADNMPIEDLKEKLRERIYRYKVVVIDSLQYSGMSYHDYKALRNEFRSTLFIIISHADGKQPSNRTGKNIKFDAHVKIYVEGFMAFVNSRYYDGGESTMKIWEEGANQYHNT